jgi:septal ring factor EnvC (AmiA/AmiB activator)
MRPAAGLCILLLLAASAPAARAQRRPDIIREIRDNQERLETIRQERASLESELQRLRGRIHSISGEIDNIEQQKGVTTRIVNELDRQIGSMSAQLDTVTLDLMLAQDALAETRAVLDTRLVEIYKRGPMWMFEVMLAAESFGDLISRYKYLYLVSRQDRALVGEVENLRDRVGQQRVHLVAIHGQLSVRRDERGQELDRFVALERRRQRALRDTEASQRVTTGRLDSLARDEERVTNMIATLEEARRRAVASGAAGAAGAGTITEADLGGLSWPVDSGEVIYRFGVTSGPDETRIRRHGLGIAVPVGTPVRAVAGGTVQYANLMGTYGPSVLVDHGGGFYTLYLYLLRFSVQADQWVNAGDVVGESGGSNSDAGPHIEFQIRGQGGIALDPEGWLRRRR